MKKTIVCIVSLIFSLQLIAQEKIQTEVGLKTDFVYLNGNIGIGTTQNLYEKLNVFGNIVVGGTNFTAQPVIFFRQNDHTNNGWSVGSTSSNSKNFMVYGYESTGDFNVYTNNTHRFIITNTGNVGIGTQSPGYKLDIQGTGGAVNIGDGTNTQTYMRFAGSRTMIGYGGANAIIQSGVGKGIGFNVNNDSFNSGTAMTLTSSGNLGIGTSTPTEKLQVSGNINLSGELRSGRGIFNSNIDAQIYLASPDTWSGISFNDVNGGDYLWFNGQHKTFSIGGQGSNVANKKLHIHGGTTIGAGYRTNGSPINGLLVEGNVGIGVTNPTEALDVNGDGKFTGEIITGNNKGLVTPDTGGNLKDVIKLNSSNQIQIGSSTVSGTTQFLGTGNYLFTGGGSLGVGTTNIPTNYKLAVAGKIITEEVKVQLQSSWPDYVFKKTYKLPTLKEIEKHIKEKGHLPNIPSAKQVAKNGIELGIMNKKLLEKIEELTLYTLQQEKRIQELTNRDKKLLTIIKNLEKRVNKIEN
jgi:hypothetical protein